MVRENNTRIIVTLSKATRAELARRAAKQLRTVSAHAAALLIEAMQKNRTGTDYDHYGDRWRGIEWTKPTPKKKPAKKVLRKRITRGHGRRPR